MGRWASQASASFDLLEAVLLTQITMAQHGDLEEYVQAQRTAVADIQRAQHYKIGSKALSTVLSETPEVMQYLVPKHSKRSKDLQTNMISSYLKALKATSELHRALDKLNAEDFEGMETALDLVPVAVPKAPKMRNNLMQTKSLEEELDEIMSEEKPSVLHEAWLAHFK
eukprot:10194037-Karenia_brevis.AAC.1